MAVREGAKRTPGIKRPRGEPRAKRTCSQNGPGYIGIRIGEGKQQCPAPGRERLRVGAGWEVWEEPQVLRYFLGFLEI